ncbi:MAG: hypothetical protein EOM63_06925, partial [Clostridia bacterium]|nr:hypothetical protein [Clostridia bacterium]
MKQTLRNQLTNIVFLVLIVSAALAIYLLSRADGETAAQAATPGAAERAVESATPAPSSETDTKKSSVRGVPESVFTTYLATSEVFSAEKSRHHAREYALTYGDSPKTKATLIYEVIDGNLSSVEIDFPVLEEYKK